MFFMVTLLAFSRETAHSLLQAMPVTYLMWVVGVMLVSSQ